MEISFSKVCSSELKAPTETEPHRIPRKTMKFLPTVRFHLNCTPKTLIFLVQLTIFQSNSIQDQCVFNKNLAPRTIEFLEGKGELLPLACKVAAEPRTEQV